MEKKLENISNKIQNFGLFIIKPEAFKFREEIKRYLEKNSDLKILESYTAKLKKGDIQKIYIDDLNTPNLKAINKHLIGKNVEISLVYGKNATSKLLGICGTSFISSDCKPKTIRREFGSDDYVIYFKIKYYLDAIHKASENEIASALNWFKNKFKKTKGTTDFPVIPSS
jgi:nucleoside diphosphate kinase